MKRKENGGNKQKALSDYFLHCFEAMSSQGNYLAGESWWQCQLAHVKNTSFMYLLFYQLSKFHDSVILTNFNRSLELYN